MTKHSKDMATLACENLLGWSFYGTVQLCTEARLDPRFSPAYIV